MGAWTKIDWPPAWKGLFARRQGAPNDRFYAEVCQNVDFVGDVIAKRAGSQHQTGWGTYSTAAWSSATTGPVADASGFSIGQTVTITDGIHAPASRLISAGTGGTTLVLSSSPGYTPGVNTAFLVKQPMAAARVDGLFNAVFRDGSAHLLAWCQAKLFEVQPPPVAASLPTLNFPETFVRAAEGWASTTSGKLDTLETLRIGDQLLRLSGLEGRTVVAINGKTTQETVLTADVRSRNVTVSPGYSSTPVPTEVFRFFPKPLAGDAHFVQFANLTHLASASYPPIKYTGTVIQRQGIEPPTSNPDVNPIGTGTTLTGRYSYRVKFRDAVTGAESEPSPILSDFPSASPAGQDVVLGNIPVSPDPQVDKKRLYRTLANGDGAWFFLMELANATTVYTDSIPDSGLGEQMREFLDNVPPTDVTVLAFWPHENRLVAVRASGSRLVFSDGPDLETGFLKGESWPVNNEIFLDYDDGDSIVGAIGFFDSLLVFKSRSIWRVTGTAPNLVIEPVSFRSDLTAIGALNQKSIAVDQNEVLFAASDGIYQIDRFWGVQQGFQSQRLTRQIDDLYQTLNTSPAVMTKTHAVFFRRLHQYRAFLALGTDTEPRDILVHQFDGTPEGEAIGWTQWNLAQANQDTAGLQISASCAAEGNPDAIFVGTVDGNVLKLDQGAVDQGCFSFPLQYRTVPFTPVGMGVPARARAVDLVFLPQTGVAIALDLATDFIQQVASASIPAASSSIALTRRALLLARGQWHQLTFSETGFASMFRVFAFDYFVQALPAESRRVDVLAPTVSYPVD